MVKLLRAAIPERVYVRDTPEYEDARNGFWALEQAQCKPHCIIQPCKSQELSDVMRILRNTGSPFGVKSGGHGRLAGESSVSSGVLIDLKRLDKVELSADKTSCKVGPGNNWKSVYGHLNPQGLMVVGGRASTVGVGGFCVSGGISFFSNRYGWALDNVLSFEVVLGDGSIVHASPESNADLYKALRGGGANFGIVTEFTLSVYPYQGLWGGGIAYDWQQADDVIDAFIAYGNDYVGNRDSSVILAALIYEGQWLYHTDIEHLKPTEPDRDSVLGRFLQIPSLDITAGPASLSERTDSIASHTPRGIHNGYYTFCTKVDKRIIKFFFETWRAETDGIIKEPGIDGSSLALADINFVPQNIIDAMSKNGGNALGRAGKEPFLVYLLEPNWSNPNNSQHIWKAMRATVVKTLSMAKELGKEDDYVYLNYANPFQDVFYGYGKDSKAFLTGVSRKYDPDGLFQFQRKAGWHLNGPLRPVDKKAPWHAADSVQD
ncbi:hypothetical protein FOYG_16161 [Fusarium oxysporum NRRL 32931]|uniref:FAD-binding PCMH-type domain-containing protein n=1 Tax=Fusarium oxysporum NRRL 32931 TaxID=660029 RepID=W9HP45_FUSOX|nr:hypothetical protein FOYG_16161 [Fusarium oxysporum NRRL 32931]